MKICNFIQNDFFEEYTLYEVFRFKFLWESKHSNIVYSRDSQSWKWIENVSKSRISCRAPMGLIIYRISMYPVGQTFFETGYVIFLEEKRLRRD